MLDELYEQWKEQNAEFLARFLRENVTVDVDVSKHSDYYGSEWFEASSSLQVNSF